MLCCTRASAHVQCHVHTLYMNLQFWEASVEDRKSEEVGNDKEDNKREDEGTPIAGY